MDWGAGGEEGEREPEDDGGGEEEGPVAEGEWGFEGEADCG